MKKKQSIWTTDTSDAVQPSCSSYIGTIVGMSESGRFLVDFSGKMPGPREARLTISARELLKKGNPVGKEVVLLFHESDPEQPIIVDALYSALDDILETHTEQKAERPDEALVDGKLITFNARDEIVLQCGAASITLTRAGKVLIKGKYVLSQASGENVLRGAKLMLG